MLSPHTSPCLDNAWIHFLYVLLTEGACAIKLELLPMCDCAPSAHLHIDLTIFVLQHINCINRQLWICMATMQFSLDNGTQYKAAQKTSVVSWTTVYLLQLSNPICMIARHIHSCSVLDMASTGGTCIHLCDGMKQ